MDLAAQEEETRFIALRHVTSGMHAFFSTIFHFDHFSPSRYFFPLTIKTHLIQRVEYVKEYVQSLFSPDYTNPENPNVRL